ncbi:uncharacterized protein YehS (DUF1456 family) [Algoriphagus iocasae]|jgi:uncharacterized protein YehS (DUF1456 family)|uniref:Uncharacterized protein YehS (DUF1456 family) n=1 Tax=Algoriphagus iocasae TaxID=1836499 RepID=A0A841MMG3_9BACT|nr:DUF1456 family protein [Algoriphagus iocasae]MBB6328093.1 uncharacterized protein YehS (DUF1456 family) [Algoriphagus iocasae]
MSNNDIFRSLRYTFDLNDFLMIEIFGMAGVEVDRPTVSSWLKKDDDEEFKPIYDKDLAAFLNGFIILKRGKKDGQDPVNEKSLSNNQVLRKLKIALNMIDEDMLNILKTAEFRLSKHELSAFFRNPSQSQYRDCKDQVLRNFLRGLQLTYRPN